MRLKDTFIIICQTFIKACILVYYAPSFSINMCQYAILRIGTLTRGLLCKKRHSLCRLKNTTIIYMITRNPWERETERACSSICKDQKGTTCLMYHVLLVCFFRVISFILIDILRWTTLLLMFVWTPSYKIPYANPFIFKISNFCPNNRRKK